MELQELFQRVHKLTGNYPKLELSDIIELQILSRKLACECADIAYDMKTNVFNY